MAEVSYKLKRVQMHRRRQLIEHLTETAPYWDPDWDRTYPHYDRLAAAIVEQIEKKFVIYGKRREARPLIPIPGQLYKRRSTGSHIRITGVEDGNPGRIYWESLNPKDRRQVGKMLPVTLREDYDWILT